MQMCIDWLKSENGCDCAYIMYNKEENFTLVNKSSIYTILKMLSGESTVQ